MNPEELKHLLASIFACGVFIIQGYWTIKKLLKNKEVKNEN